MNIRRSLPLVAIAAVAMIAATLAGPTQPSAQSPSWDTVTDSVLPVSNPTQPSTGPGYKPPAPTNQTCNCADCITEADVRKIVADELKARGYGSARPTTTNGSAGGGGVERIISERVISSSPTVTYQSSPPPPVYYQSPAPVYYQSTQPVQSTTVRTGLFGRRYQTYSTPQSPKSCRIVNGQVVCQ